MKKIFFAAIMLLIVSSAFALKPRPKSMSSVIEEFKKDFPAAQNVQWETTDRDYQANFKIDNVRYWLVLDKIDGSQTYLVKYYDESQLRSDLKSSLYNHFPNTKISRVTEINAPNGTVYQVNLDQKDKWFIVLMDDQGNTTLKNSFNKSN